MGVIERSNGMTLAVMDEQSFEQVWIHWQVIGCYENATKSQIVLNKTTTRWKDIVCLVTDVSLIHWCNRAIHVPAMHENPTHIIPRRRHDTLFSSCSPPVPMLNSIDWQQQLFLRQQQLLRRKTNMTWYWQSRSWSATLPLTPGS